MSRTIFVNLPVSDLERSKRFYEAIGASNEPKFTDSTAACMQLSESIFVMLLTQDKFRQFTPHPIADGHSSSQVLLALSHDSRAAVDLTVERASQAGGKADPALKQDYGFMYSQSVADPDGHIWEIFWMDKAAAEQGASSMDEAETA